LPIAKQFPLQQIYASPGSTLQSFFALIFVSFTTSTESGRSRDFVSREVESFSRTEEKGKAMIHSCCAGLDGDVHALIDERIKLKHLLFVTFFFEAAQD
jgi:hypothetical protein